MAFEIEVLFSPAEFRTLPARDLRDTTCVVFDVLRATSTIVTALAAGAAGVIPVGEIKTALEWRQQQPDVMLAGERHGLRIDAALTGGVEFDLGNSPREFTAKRVSGRLIVTTTTNGTHALGVCAKAAELLVCCFLNTRRTAVHLARSQGRKLCLVCAGTGEDAALEDTLAAGALCEELLSNQPATKPADSAVLARLAFLQSRGDLANAVRQSSNARRLLCLPELHDDVEFCLRLNSLDLVAQADPHGIMRRLD